MASNSYKRKLVDYERQDQVEAAFTCDTERPEETESKRKRLNCLIQRRQLATSSLTSASHDRRAAGMDV
ncbi:hypothetical protein CBS101457_004371 [Exobasidium rhododendri]|nr:hypothetical protein CBS101457_004371 [Exobasidium rhododendri]